MMLARLGMFLLGWQRRSAMILDNAGAPRWLIRWRCPKATGWGAVLDVLARDIEGTWR